MSDSIGKLFDGIAGTYDRFNHLLSLNIDRKWRKKAVRELCGSGIVLDVATGTADMAIEVIRQNKADRVRGIDISEQMMSLGRQKVEKAGLQERISLEYGSALDIPFPDNTFDAVVCAYGVRNFSDLDRGLAEMCRVLRPGGRMVVLEFSYPSNPFVRAVYDFYFSRIMPLVGRALSKDAGAYSYFRDSVKGFIWGREMARRLEKAGLSDVEVHPLTFGITTVYKSFKP